MMNRIVTKARQALGIVMNRIAPKAVELQLRQQAAFAALHPGVQSLKASPTVQIAVAAAVTGLALNRHATRGWNLDAAHAALAKAVVA